VSCGKSRCLESPKSGLLFVVVALALSSRLAALDAEGDEEQEE
jgi:hypothetical protein